MIEINDEPDFNFGSTEYCEFFSKFGLSPFQHPDWLEPFYRRLPAAAGQTPLILVARRVQTGELCSVVPLLKDANARKSRVTFAFLGVTDYACPVIDPALLGNISLQNNLQRLVGDHVLEIAPIHDDHRTIWLELLGSHPIPLDFGSHAIIVGPAEGVQSESGRVKSIKGLQRKARRLATLGDLRLVAVTGLAARSAIDKARQFRAGRFPDDPLETDSSAAFYADVAGSANGLSRTFQLMNGDCVIAVMFGLVHRKRFHYIILACDYATYAKYSPGLLIMDRAIQAWAEAGGEVFDFTIGDEPFKTQFGCNRTTMYSIRSEFQKVS